MTNHIDFGIPKSIFLNEVLERKLHVVRGAVSPTLVGWTDVNKALHCIDAATPYAKLHLDGLVPEDKYLEEHSIVGMTDKRFNRKALYDYMRNGATLVLLRMDARLEILRRLCAEVASFSNSETLSNGYLAFSGNGSFGKHWDTHDVMVVQLIGNKRWKIYKPTFQLPLAGQISKHHRHECPSEPVFDGVLEAGDLLYIPRGWWHDTLPIGETFHAAIGMHTPALLHYVKWLCAQVLGHHIELRHSVRPGADNLAELPAAIDVVRRAMANPEHFSDFLNELHPISKAINAPFSIETFG